MSIPTKCGKITVEEFNKFDRLYSDHSYDKVLDIIREVRNHPKLWHDFGDRRQLTIEWNQVEMALNGYEFPTHYGAIRETWRQLYTKYMFDKTGDCPFEDQLSFLWDFRAEAYWIWDEEDCVYMRPVPIEDAPSTSWRTPELKNNGNCYPCKKEDFVDATCEYCELYHNDMGDAEFLEQQEAYYPEDMDHYCFNTITCVTTRQQNAYFCYVMKNFEKEHCKQASKRVSNYMRAKTDGKTSRDFTFSRLFELDALEDESFNLEKIVEVAQDTSEDEEVILLQESMGGAPISQYTCEDESSDQEELVDDIQEPSVAEEVILPQESIYDAPIIQETYSEDHEQADESQIPDDPAPKASEVPETTVLEQPEVQKAVVAARQLNWKDSWEMLLLAGLLVNLIVMLTF